MKTVTLVKPHTHAGIHYPAGEKITVSETDYLYLKDRHVITLKSAKVAPAADANNQEGIENVTT